MGQANAGIQAVFYQNTGFAPCDSGRITAVFYLNTSLRTTIREE